MLLVLKVIKIMRCILHQCAIVNFDLLIKRSNLVNKGTTSLMQRLVLLSHANLLYFPFHAIP